MQLLSKLLQGSPLTGHPKGTQDKHRTPCQACHSFHLFDFKRERQRDTWFRSWDKLMCLFGLGFWHHVGRVQSHHPGPARDSVHLGSYCCWSSPGFCLLQPTGKEKVTVSTREAFKKQLAQCFNILMDYITKV